MYDFVYVSSWVKLNEQVSAVGESADRLGVGMQTEKDSHRCM